MFRLVADEFQKLKRTWILPLLPLAFLLAPALGVLTVRDNSTHNPRILFDWATTFSQVQLDNTLFVAPLILGALAVFLLQREYQEATLEPLLTIPIAPARLLTAKLLVVAAIAAVGSVVSSAAVVPLTLLVGSPATDANQILPGSLRLVWGELLTLPVAFLPLAAAILFRNYLVTAVFSFASIVFGLVALSLNEAMVWVPWLGPTLLSVDEKTIESLGLLPSEVSQASATFTIFAGLVTGLLYGLFVLKNRR